MENQTAKLFGLNLKMGQGPPGATPRSASGCVHIFLLLLRVLNLKGEIISRMHKDKDKNDEITQHACKFKT
jgi:hypothetical protein